MMTHRALALGIAFVPRPYTLISPAGSSRWPEEEASYR